MPKLTKRDEVINYLKSLGYKIDLPNNTKLIKLLHDLYIKDKVYEKEYNNDLWWCNLGFYYHKKGETKLMKKYYLKSVKKGLLLVSKKLDIY